MEVIIDYAEMFTVLNDKYPRVRFSAETLTKERSFRLKAAIGPMGIDEKNEMAVIPWSGGYAEGYRVYSKLCQMAEKLKNDP